MDSSVAPGGTAVDLPSIGAGDAEAEAAAGGGPVVGTDIVVVEGAAADVGLGFSGTGVVRVEFVVLAPVEEDGTADFPLSASARLSRKSDSIRPFEASDRYPGRTPVGSAYHAVIFAVIRTEVSPLAVAVETISHW
jgi:hypothetical protein